MTAATITDFVVDPIVEAAKGRDAALADASSSR